MIQQPEHTMKDQNKVNSNQSKDVPNQPKQVESPK